MNSDFTRTKLDIKAVKPKKWSKMNVSATKKLFSYDITITIYFDLAKTFSCEDYLKFNTKIDDQKKNINVLANSNKNIYERNIVIDSDNIAQIIMF